MAELELVRVRCTSCGADFEDVREDQEVFACKRLGCGAIFRVSHGKLFAMIEKEKAEKIANHRRALYEALDAFQADSAFEYAAVIIGMLPDDFRANIAQRLAQMKASSGDPRALRSYLNECPEATETEFREVFPYIVKYAGYSELKCLERALPVYASGETLKTLKAQLARAFESIETANRDYADVNRDVFICHSSENSEFAEDVYESLGKDGRKVWISTHNLAPHSMNYWQDIENAIRKCDVFAVIASRDAMMSHDVQREMAFAQSLGKPRVEIKIDSYPHTEFFKDFFDGISWIDACGDETGALQALNKRVMLLARKAQEDMRNAQTAGEQNSDAKEFTVKDVSDFADKVIHVIKTILAFLFPVLKKYLLKAKESAVRIAGETVAEIRKSETFNNIKNKVSEVISELESQTGDGMDEAAPAQKDDAFEAEYEYWPEEPEEAGEAEPETAEEEAEEAEMEAAEDEEAEEAEMEAAEEEAGEAEPEAAEAEEAGEAEPAEAEEAYDTQGMTEGIDVAQSKAEKNICPAENAYVNPPKLWKYDGYNK